MLFSYFKWVFGRWFLGALIAALGLAAYGLWLFAHDTGDFDGRRDEQRAALAGKRQEMQRGLEDVARRREAATAEIDAEDARGRQADKVIVTLRSLESTWDRFIGNPAQQKANAEQIKRMEQIRDDARTRQADLKQVLTRLIWERDGLELELGKIDGQIAFAEQHSSIGSHYLAEAWLRARWVLSVALVGYFFWLLMFAPRPRRE